MSYESFGHKKGISRDESVLCLYITDNLEKELFLKCIFRHFVTVGLLQEQTICGLFFKVMKNMGSSLQRTEKKEVSIQRRALNGL